MADLDMNLMDLESPIEMSATEYQEMIKEVTGLTNSEAEEEYLQSCRYGEIDIVRILLRRFPSLLHHNNEHSGNSGLHMAAANGHTNVANLLLKSKHGFATNSSGNTPLHFAAINSQDAMVHLLTTQNFHDVNVLQQNDFGRSALTEGFTSQNEHVVKSLLEHDSATEEKLLSTDGASIAHHIHDLFDRDHPLRVRELAMTNADNPFADTERPDQDTTGLSIWSAALVLARWTQIDSWEDASIIELGAGCGVPGLTVASSVPSPKKVYLTDLNPKTVKNLEYNITLNKLRNSEAFCMDWSDKSTWPEEKVDFVIGSDLIYQKSLVPLLMEVIFGLLPHGGTFFYVAPDTGRDGLVEFLERMKEACPVWTTEIAPPQYHANPLVNGDDEECFLHFQELSSLTYCLHKFEVAACTSLK